MAVYSFFQLTPPRRLMPDDALPGISLEEDLFLALITTLHEAIGAFQDAHPDTILTWGDVIHASKCVTENLISDYAETDPETDEDDASLDDENLDA